MKLLLVGEGDQHLGCLEFEGNSIVVKKYKPGLDAKIVDAPEEDDKDDISPEGMEEDDDKESKMSDVFAMKKKPVEHEEEESDEYEAEEEQAMKSKKPMKFKRPGLF